MHCRAFQLHRNRSTTMTDPTDSGGTPKYTPRRTLGISRRTPKSAPTPIVDNPMSPLQTINRSLDANDNKPAQSESHIQIENSYSTPIVRKRNRVVEPTATTDAATKVKIGKKLNLSPTTSPDRVPAQVPQNESFADVRAEIIRIETEIDAMNKHDERKRKLNDSIDQWRSCAVQALQELQEKIEPKQSIETILDHLGIPHEMFDISSMQD